MRDKTDIEKVKRIALTCLHMQPVRDLEHPKEAEHMYLWSEFTEINGKIYSIVEDRKAFAYDIKPYIAHIEHQTTAFGVYEKIIDSYKLTFLKLIKPYLSRGDLSLILANVWAERNIPCHDNNVSWSMMLCWLRQTNRMLLMDKYYYYVYRHLPNEIEVYKDVSDKSNSNPFLWTFNKIRACFNQKGRILWGTIRKCDVFAYIGDEQLVIDPTKLKNKTRITY